MTVPEHDPLHEACRAYLEARETFIRTPRSDAGFWRKAQANDDAHDRLVTLLTLHGAVLHHAGFAWWVERGELHRGKVESFRIPRKKQGAEQ